MSTASVKHLLVPKEFKVWCRPNKSAAGLDFTSQAPKATCANCLTRFRQKKTGRQHRFKVADIPGRRREFEDNAPRCAICGARIYLQSEAEGYYCPTCGASDSDES